MPSPRITLPDPMGVPEHFVLHEVPMKLLQRNTARATHARLRNIACRMRTAGRVIDALYAPITLYLAQRLGLKFVPNASHLLTRKSLIPKEMLPQVSPHRGASGGARARAHAHTGT